ncbi:ABC transporter permease [Terrimonas sp. NA20]|uniref:ABC transporter permease n=1 Tax=Terrimonas ginsenosidimutans TaxID=2908004 RepID=A0ABS9KMF8_9BACT|nr:ABC transporter permease [Terrimonas ginsenosidimutans]MCG2613513.1 ABC transporter permease [Terrimonas ginsenosidimutans]
MPASYLKLFRRNLLKERQFSILNIAGLSTGLACALFIFMWVSSEKEVDRFNENDNRLFLVMKNFTNADGSIRTMETTQGMLAKSVAEELPEVEYSVSVKSDGTGIIGAGDKNLTARASFAGRDFLKVFSYKILAGNKETMLTGTAGILLSANMAKALFDGSGNIIGQTINWNRGNEFSGLYTVAGIFEQPPTGSTDQFDILFSYDLYTQKKAEDVADWSSNSMRTFLLLKNGTDTKAFNDKIRDYTRNKLIALHGKNDEKINKEGSIFLQRYSDRYLYNHFENGKQNGGRIQYVNLFSLIAVFILLIACVNFMNLSTARASARMKEIGVRKLMGASRSGLILRFMTESVLMSIFSLLIAIGLVFVFLEPFNNITGKQLSFPVNIQFFISIFCTAFLTGITAGSYPAIFLSGFKPVRVLKGKLSTSLTESRVRKGLVVFQFTVSAVMIISVLVVNMQMKLIQEKNLGYSKDNIIRFSGMGKLRKEGLSAFITEVQKIPGVIGVSSMSGTTTGRFSQSGSRIEWPGKTEGKGIEFDGLDLGSGMMELLDLTIKEGRSFSTDHTSDTNSIIFNETAIAAMKLENPIGKTVNVWGKPKQIIGIVKDFQFESMYKKVNPFFLRYVPNNNMVYVKINAGQERKSLAAIGTFYKQYNMGLPFEYRFLDEDYDLLYATEDRISTLSRYFAGIVIIISCLGLLGLAAFTAARRRAEIGVRKVIGASVTDIVVMLSADFLKLVVIAILIASPFAWWIMHSWLQNFSYRVDMNVGIYLIAALLIIILSLITTASQAIRAAVANPVKALRSE